jgi:hypothetical protein
MRRVLEILLVQLLLLGCTIASEQQTNTELLVIDVYSVRASNVNDQKDFAGWAQHLRDGKASLTRFPKILHAEYPLGEAFHIANEAQPEADSPKVVVAGHGSANGGARCVQDHIFRAWPASCLFRSNLINAQAARATRAKAATYRFWAERHAGDSGVNPVQNQRPGRQREIALRDQLEYSAKVMAALRVGGDAQSTYRPRAGGKGWAYRRLRGCSAR